MTQTSSNQDQLANQLADLHAMLAQGQFLEAMDKYLADDAVLQEGDAEPKQGKAFAMDFEAKFLETVTEFGGYEVLSTAVSGDKTFYEAVMSFTTKDGGPTVIRQAVVDTWKDGKIVHERFYHA